MKPFLLAPILMIALFPLLQAQPIAMEGVVVLQNSEFELGELRHLGGIRVQSPNTAPARSNFKGKFKLLFTEGKAGTQVNLEVKHPDFVVVNPEALRNIELGRKGEIQIVMANADYLRRRRMAIQGHLKQRLTKAFADSYHDGREQNPDVDKISDNRFPLTSGEVSFLKLEKRAEKVKRRLLDHSMGLVRINLDGSADSFRDAYAHLLLGEVEASLEKLKPYDPDFLLGEGWLSRSDVATLEVKDFLQVVEGLELRAVLQLFQLNFQEAIKHYQVIAELLDRKEADHYLQAKFISELGWLQTICKVEGSGTTFRKLADLVESLPDQRHPFLVKVYENIGDHFFFRGKFDRSVGYYERSISISQDLNIEDRHLLPELYNKVANNFIFLEKYEKAFCFLNKAIAIQENNRMSNRVELAESYINMGRVFTSMGNGKRSLQYYQKALKIHEVVYESHQPELIRIYYLNAGSYEEMGKQREALDFYQKALRIAETVYRAQHSELGIANLNVGKIYYALGESGKALSYYKNAIAIIENILEKNNPALLIAYKSIAAIHEDLADYDQSLFYHEIVLNIERETLGPNHPNLVLTYHNVAKVYSLMGNQTKARYYMQRAIELSKRPATKFTVEETREAEPMEPERLLVSVPAAPANTAPVPAPEQDVNGLSKQAASEPVAKLSGGEDQSPGAEPLAAVRKLLLERAFAQAEAASIDYLGEQPDQNALRVMLILAHLYQGNFQKAKSIWYLFRNKSLTSGASFSGQLADELDFLQKNGVVHAQVSQFRRMIGDGD